MAGRVYLHIGEPKSGTTFIQDVLWSNRAALARQQVLLPGLGVNDHFRAAQDLRGVGQSADDPAGSWAGEWELLAEQARPGAHTAVISHELLVGADAERAAHAVRSLHPAEVHIVLTVRDLASLLPAEWQETVKHRNVRTWPRWLADVADDDVALRHRRARWFWTAHDTLDVLVRWTQLVPPERVHVITVPRPDAPADLLWQRFAGVVGIDPAAIDTAGARRNASLGRTEVELLRRLNQRLPADRLPTWFYLRVVKDGLAQDLLAARPGATRLRVPDERLAWVRERGQRVRTGLQGSGYDIVGELDELTATPAPGRPERAVTDAELLDGALDALAGLLDREYTAATRAASLRQVLHDHRATLVQSHRVRRAMRGISARYPSVSRLRLLGGRVAQRSCTRQAR
jgi:hypothetical protein